MRHSNKPTPQQAYLNRDKLRGYIFTTLHTGICRSLPRWLVLLSAGFWVVTVSAEESPVVESEHMVYVKQVKGEMQKIYKRVFNALEANGYYVIFEPNIGRNLSHFAERWGKDYNKNKLEAIRSMVFCNGWYANQVSNLDPDMLALCPLHITLTHKAGLTRVLFIRPSRVAANSPARDVALELEQDVIRTIEMGAGQ